MNGFILFCLCYSAIRYLGTLLLLLACYGVWGWETLLALFEFCKAIPWWEKLFGLSDLKYLRSFWFLAGDNALGSITFGLLPCANNGFYGPVILEWMLWLDSVLFKFCDLY